MSERRLACQGPNPISCVPPPSGEAVHEPKCDAFRWAVSRSLSARVAGKYPLRPD